MNIRGLTPTGAEKLDRTDNTGEISNRHKRHDKQYTHSTSTSVFSEDSIGSAPEIEYYNNYSKDGGLKSEAIDVPDVPDSTAAEPQSETERLVQALRENEKYVSLLERPHGLVSYTDLVDIPEWQELGLHLIENLSDEDYEILQKMLWSKVASYHARISSEGTLGAVDLRPYLPLEENHQDYDLASIWNTWGGNIQESDGALGHYFEFEFRTFLTYKMCSEGLTDAERAFSPDHARREEREGLNSTFSNRMGSVADYVSTLFSEAKQALSSSERFTIKLNSNFSFNVSGGAGNNAEFLQGVLNDAGKWLLPHILDSIFTHRGENGEIPRWLATPLDNDIWRNLAEDRGLGYINVSNDFYEGIDRLRAARARNLTEEWLQEEFGFGLDDLVYEDGVLSGRTQEITDVINSDERFETHLHSSRTLNSASIAQALNTPKEQDLSFLSIVFEDGKFSILY